jgi:hypothetical protein
MTVNPLAHTCDLPWKPSDHALIANALVLMVAILGGCGELPREEDTNAAIKTVGCDHQGECFGSFYINSRDDGDPPSHIEHCSIMHGYIEIVNTTLPVIELPCLRETRHKFIISSNNLLERIDLPAYRKAVDINISDNASLVEVEAPQLKRIGGDLLLHGTPALEWFSAPNLKLIGEDLLIDDLDALPNLDGLAGLQLVGGTVRIVDNDSLCQTTAEDFAASLKVKGAIEVSGNGGDCP